MFIYILAATVTFLLFVATTVHTSSLGQATIYKFVPVVLAFVLAVYGSSEIGYITINWDYYNDL